MHELTHCSHREAEVLKAIANGMAVRCRKRKEENMIRQLKMLHEKRQEESKKYNLAKKQNAWAKIGSTQEMVAIAKNFRLALTQSYTISNIAHELFRKIAIESNMERELEKELLTSQAHMNSQHLDRELSQSASRMRIAGMSVQQNLPNVGKK